MPSILIIEDNEEMLDDLAAIFKMVGYTVYTATTGAEGLSQAEAHQPDVILSDIRMPGEMDGLGLLARIRAHPQLAKTPFIIHSAFQNTEYVQKAQSLGADAFLGKPTSIEKLLSTVADFV